MSVINKPPSRLNLKTLLFVGVLLILGLIVFLEVTNKTHLFHKRNETETVSSASQETKGETGSTKSETNGDKSVASQDKNSGQNNKTNGTSTAALVLPTGNFVSSHITTGESPQSSDCTTTVGATCEIIFTKDGVIKTLPAQTTDKGGSTYWSWTPSQYGLTEGVWKIQARASLSGQTITADDAMNLEVRP